MKTELKVVKLHNGDVISTSSCADAFGAMSVYSEIQFLGYKNGEKDRDNEYGDGDYKTIKNYQGQVGLYHFHVSSGKIVLDGKCNSAEPFKDHNIKIDK